MLDKGLITPYSLLRRLRIVRLSYHLSLCRTLFYSYQRSARRFNISYTCGLNALAFSIYDIVESVSYG